MPIPLFLSAALVASVSRCNNDVATQLEDQLRAYDGKHVSAPADLDQRIGDLAGIVQQAGAESDIVTNVCPNAADLARVETDLNADVAWALAQLAGVNYQKMLPQCPDGADPIAAGFLAAGWRRLVLATPPPDQKPSAYVVKLTALYREQAAALKLDLPATSDASDYWVKTIQNQGNAAAQACPTPK
jgi:hypothetical protein